MDETPDFLPLMVCEPPLTEAEQKMRADVQTFAHWMRTYIVDVAKRLGERFQKEEELHESGFFILAGLTSYFEGVGQHILGTAGVWKEKKQKRFSDHEEYEKTWNEVFGSSFNHDETVAERFKDCIRNGLAHDGAVRNRVVLSRHFTTAIRPICDGRQLVGFEINPYRVALAVEEHFKQYIAKLLSRSEEHHDLRERFAGRRCEVAHDYPDARNCTPSSYGTPGPNGPNS